MAKKRVFSVGLEGVIRGASNHHCLIIRFFSMLNAAFFDEFSLDNSW